MQALSKPTDEQLIEPKQRKHWLTDDIRQAIFSKILF